jgi:hypothetical protein
MPIICNSYELKNRPESAGIKIWSTA